MDRSDVAGAARNPAKNKSALHRCSNVTRIYTRALRQPRRRASPLFAQKAVATYGRLQVTRIDRDRRARPRMDPGEERRELSLFAKRIHDRCRQQEVRQHGPEQHQRGKRERAIRNRAEGHGGGIREGARRSSQPGHRANRHELNQNVHGRHDAQSDDHLCWQVRTRAPDLPATTAPSSNPPNSSRMLDASPPSSGAV